MREIQSAVAGLMFIVIMTVAATAVVAQSDAESDSIPAAGARQIGTIEALGQDSGTIDISGRRYSVVNGQTRVVLDGRALRLHHLDNGMVVAYVTDGSGTLIRIELLGPADKLRALEQH